MSLKLTLITSLVTVSVAGISTGSYFLLKGNSTEESKQQNTKADSGGGAKAVTSEVSGGQSAPKPSDSESNSELDAATKSAG